METLVARGQARYGIYCTPCHDGTGSGNGLVASARTRAARRRSSRRRSTRTASATCPMVSSSRPSRNGKNNMPPYAMQIPVDDRWAIVAYVRALQIAQPKGTEAHAVSAAKSETRSTSRSHDLVGAQPARGQAPGRSSPASARSASPARASATRSTRGASRSRGCSPSSPCLSIALGCDLLRARPAPHVGRLERHGAAHRRVLRLRHPRADPALHPDPHVDGAPVPVAR